MEGGQPKTSQARIEDVEAELATIVADIHGGPTKFLEKLALENWTEEDARALWASLPKKEELLRKEEELLREEKNLLLRIQLEPGAATMKTDLETLQKTVKGQGEEILRELRSKTLVCAAISHASTSEVNKVVSAVHLLGFMTGDEEGIQESPFRPFDWPQDAEVVDSEGACKHFVELLKGCGVSINNRGGWKVLDIKSKKDFLNTQLGNIAISGTADAVVVPYKVGGMAYLQLRVVLDWKLPRDVDWEKCENQAKLEYLAAAAKSNAPVMGVVTDLQTTFHILRPVSSSSGGGWGLERLTVSPKIGMSLIVDFLNSVSSYELYRLDDDPNAPEKFFRAYKKLKEAVPESALERSLELAEFLPWDEKLPYVWEILEHRRLQQAHMENHFKMFS